jgi:large subunit ribosomal protein L22
MEVTATYKNLRMSAQKAREVVRQVRGMNAVQALSTLGFVRRKAATAVAKTLKSAIANAENNHGLKSETLVIAEAHALTAGSMTRFLPKARGSAGPMLKRSCHIKIVLTNK